MIVFPDLIHSFKSHSAFWLLIISFYFQFVSCKIFFSDSVSYLIEKDKIFYNPIRIPRNTLNIIIKVTIEDTSTIQPYLLLRYNGLPSPTNTIPSAQYYLDHNEYPDGLTIIDKYPESGVLFIGIWGGQDINSLKYFTGSSEQAIVTIETRINTCAHPLERFASCRELETLPISSIGATSLVRLKTDHSKLLTYYIPANIHGIAFDFTINKYDLFEICTTIDPLVVTRFHRLDVMISNYLEHFDDDRNTGYVKKSYNFVNLCNNLIADPVLSAQATTSTVPNSIQAPTTDTLKVVSISNPQLPSEIEKDLNSALESVQDLSSGDIPPVKNKSKRNRRKKGQKANAGLDTEINVELPVHRMLAQTIAANPTTSGSVGVKEEDFKFNVLLKYPTSGYWIFNVTLLLHDSISHHRIRSRKLTAQDASSDIFTQESLAIPDSDTLESSETELTEFRRLQNSLEVFKKKQAKSSSTTSEVAGKATSNAASAGNSAESGSTATDSLSSFKKSKSKKSMSPTSSPSTSQPTKKARKSKKPSALPTIASIDATIDEVIEAAADVDNSVNTDSNKSSDSDAKSEETAVEPVNENTDAEEQVVDLSKQTNDKNDESTDSKTSDTEAGDDESQSDKKGGTAAKNIQVIIESEEIEVETKAEDDVDSSTTVTKSEPNITADANTDARGSWFSNLFGDKKSTNLDKSTDNQSPKQQIISVDSHSNSGNMDSSTNSDNIIPISSISASIGNADANNLLVQKSAKGKIGIKITAQYLSCPNGLYDVDFITATPKLAMNCLTDMILMNSSRSDSYSMANSVTPIKSIYSMRPGSIDLFSQAKLKTIEESVSPAVKQRKLLDISGDVITSATVTASTGAAAAKVGSSATVGKKLTSKALDQAQFRGFLPSKQALPHGGTLQILLHITPKNLTRLMSKIDAIASQYELGNDIVEDKEELKEEKYMSAQDKRQQTRSSSIWEKYNDYMKRFAHFNLAVRFDGIAYAVNQDLMMNRKRKQKPKPAEDNDEPDEVTITGGVDRSNQNRRKLGLFSNLFGSKKSPDPPPEDPYGNPLTSSDAGLDFSDPDGEEGGVVKKPKKSKINLNKKASLNDDAASPYNDAASDPIDAYETESLNNNKKKSKKKSKSSSTDDMLNSLDLDTTSSSNSKGSKSKKKPVPTDDSMSQTDTSSLNDNASKASKKNKKKSVSTDDASSADVESDLNADEGGLEEVADGISVKPKKSSKTSKDKSTSSKSPNDKKPTKSDKSKKTNDKLKNKPNKSKVSEDDEVSAEATDSTDTGVDDADNLSNDVSETDEEPVKPSKKSKDKKSKGKKPIRSDDAASDSVDESNGTDEAGVGDGNPDGDNDVDSNDNADINGDGNGGNNEDIDLDGNIDSNPDKFAGNGLDNKKSSKKNSKGSSLISLFPEDTSDSNDASTDTTNDSPLDDLSKSNGNDIGSIFGDMTTEDSESNTENTEDLSSDDKPPSKDKSGDKSVGKSNKSSKKKPKNNGIIVGLNLATEEEDSILDESDDVAKAEDNFDAAMNLGEITKGFGKGYTKSSVNAPIQPLMTSLSNRMRRFASNSIELSTTKTAFFLTSSSLAKEQSIEGIKSHQMISKRGYVARETDDLNMFGILGLESSQASVMTTVDTTSGSPAATDTDDDVFEETENGEITFLWSIPHPTLPGFGRIDDSDGNMISINVSPMYSIAGDDLNEPLIYHPILEDFSVSIRLSFLTCPPDYCNNHGTCVEQIDGEMIISSCKCKYPYAGERCDHTSILYIHYIVEVWALVVSNTATIPAILYGLRYSNLIITMLLMAIVVSSGCYHFCDMDYHCVFDLTRHSLMLLDVILTILTICSLVIYFSPMPSNTQFAWFIIIMTTIITPLVESNPRSPFTIVLALMLTFAICIWNWVRFINLSCQLQTRREIKDHMSSVKSFTKELDPNKDYDSDEDRVTFRANQRKMKQSQLDMSIKPDPLQSHHSEHQSHDIESHRRSSDSVSGHNNVEVTNLNRRRRINPQIAMTQLNTSPSTSSAHQAASIMDEIDQTGNEDIYLLQEAFQKSSLVTKCHTIVVTCYKSIGSKPFRNFITSFAIGLGSLTAATLCLVLQSNSSYWYLHSMWHIFISFAAMCFMYSRSKLSRWLRF